MTETHRYKNYTAIEFDRPLDRVLRLTLNNPERMNSLDARGHAELAEAVSYTHLTLPTNREV